MWGANGWTWTRDSAGDKSACGANDPDCMAWRRVSYIQSVVMMCLVENAEPADGEDMMKGRSPSPPGVCGVWCIVCSV